MPEFFVWPASRRPVWRAGLGFSYDEVEDLRLAIDELCFGLTGPTGRAGTVELRYLLGDDGLVVEGQGHFVDDIAPVGLTELSEVILSALVDEHRSRRAPTVRRFRLVKRHQDTPASSGG